MSETIKTTFALNPETIERIEAIAKTTFRGKSDVIDWLVADAWSRMQNITAGQVTVEEMLEGKAVT